VGVQNNPYGASKVSAESFMAVYAKLHGFDVTLLRYFNPYGPTELCDPETHFVPNLVRSALADEPVPLYWKGEQIRDFIFVEDLARAHAAVLDSKGLNVYNVGTGKGTKVKDILQVVTDILGRPVRIKDLGERPGDVHASYAAADRIREAVGWQAKVGLEEGLTRTVEFFKERLASGGARWRGSA
jgi:UDP-glucose 4-epimerase